MAGDGSPAAAGGLPAAAVAVTDSDAAEDGGLDNLLRQLEADESLRAFVAADFSPAAHVGDAVRSGAVAASLAASEAAAARLSATVRAEVVRRKEALLTEVAAVGALEGEVSTLAAGVGSLSAASAGLASGLAAPHVPLREAAAKLGHLHEAAHLLRLVVRVRRAVDRLTDARLMPSAGGVGGGRRDGTGKGAGGTSSGVDTVTAAASAPADSASGDQLVAAADAIHELDEMLSSVDGPSLSQLAAVRPDLPAVRAAGAALRGTLTSTLAAALDGRDGAAAAVALSGWHALGGLRPAVAAQQSRLVADVSAAVVRGLTPPPSSVRPMVGGIGAPASGGVQQLLPTAREVWAAVDTMMERIAELAATAVLLQVTLMKTYDAGGGGGASYAPLLVSSLPPLPALPRSWGESAGRGQPATPLPPLPPPPASLSVSMVDAIAARLAGAVATLAAASPRTAAGVRYATLVADYPRLAVALATAADRVDAAARGATARFVPVAAVPPPSLGGGVAAAAAAAAASAAATALPSRRVVVARLTAAVRAVGERHVATSLERVTAPLRGMFDDDARPPVGAGMGSPGGGDASVAAAAGGARHRGGGSPSGRLPDEADAAAFAGVLAAELAATWEGGESLRTTAVANVLRALRLFTARAEATAAVSASMVGDGSGAADTVLPVSALSGWRMAPLYNALVTVATAAERGLGRLDRGPAPAAGPGATLVPALAVEAAAMRSLATSLIDRLFARVTPSIAGVLSDVHDEPWAHGADGGAAAPGGRPPRESAYVADVARRLRVFHAGIVVRVARSPALAAAVARLAAAVLSTWVVHVSCLPGPVSPAGRAYLAADAAALAAAVDGIAAVDSLDAVSTAAGVGGLAFPASSAFAAARSAVDVDDVAATVANDEAVAALGGALDGLPPSAAARVLLFRAPAGGAGGPLPATSKLLIPPRRVRAGDGAAYARQLLATGACGGNAMAVVDDADADGCGDGGAAEVAGDPAWAEVAAGLAAHEAAVTVANEPPAAEAALVRSLTPTLLRQWRERQRESKGKGDADW
ncbi:hypothetical protein I4F81_000637 [Pyropia yezoensis]|uniref:Uncharacterized protein n=1 Tax=Pyropia yezoensis TaxID=2788 RepID=A0ACC3BJD8_PYRYE|nr:hypothetical protein I4F81_000637 [Neopyropia yezoensis]